MKVEKKIIGALNKCYSISLLNYKHQPCFLIAAEKHDPCLLFSEDGTQLQTIWQKPGGVMTMLPVPDANGAFLATHQFYSPNDGADAKIVLATPVDGHDWQVRTLVDAPYVHRFGILHRNGINYLIVCCLKSKIEHKDDWRFPGACYSAVLPEDLGAFNANRQLPLRQIKGGLLKNHGYSLVHMDGYDAALIGCENGVFLFHPPVCAGENWEIQQLLDIPCSDAVLMDFDGDGQLELGCIAPFHGASLVIYHLDEHGRYLPQWKYSRPESETEMIHATWACNLLGKPTWLVGWRKGSRDTIAITWNDGDYATEFIDRNTGCANLLHFVNQHGKDVIIATNREIDEIAMYTVTE